MKMTAMAGRRARVMTSLPANAALAAVIPILLASRAEVAGMHPFGISMFGALLPTPFGGAALAVGALLMGAAGIKYILCGAAFYALCYLRRLDRIAAATALGAILTIGGLLEMLWGEPGVIAAIKAPVEGVAGGLLFYIFGSLRAGAKAYARESRERLCARLLILGACANGLAGISIPPGIPLNVFAGLLALMFICGSVGLCETVTAGMVLGIMCAMNGEAVMAVMGLFAASALFASLLREFGKWGTVLGFLCGSALCVICGESFYAVSFYLWAVVAAMVVFAAVPEFVCDNLQEKIRTIAAEPDTRDERERLGKKLRIVTRQHSDICTSLKRINDELAREEAQENSEAIYSVFTAVSQRADGGAAVSGDCYLEFDSELGRHYVILCDGMGSGRRAYRESKMTAELLREFLRTGFLKDKAVGMLNSALAIKGDDESFSTVDLFEFDTRSGMAEFLKIGSAESFIRHRDELETLSSASLPVGIVEEVRTNTISRRLSAGDMIVMVSDGVGEAGYGVLKGEWIKRMIKASNGDMQGLADEILAEAQRRSFPEKDDDMTVVAMRIERAKKGEE